MSAYVRYHASNEVNAYDIEIDASTMYGIHFASAIVSKEGFHRDPVPGSGLDVDFRTANGEATVEVSKSGDPLARMRLSNSDGQPSADVKFLSNLNKDGEIAASGILKACALAWAAA